MSSDVNYNSAATLQQLVYNVEMAMSDFTAASLDVTARLGNIYRERLVLRDIRERLIVLRGPVVSWEETLWDTSWKFESSSDRQRWLSAHAKARELHSLIDRLLWGLHQFRKPDAEGECPP